jgi:pimeloyl-ACP methyl ester carboxylesterase
MTEPPPPIDGWINAGLAMPARPGWVTHDGLRLRIREWGDPGQPGVVLVHGSTAHTHWWDHIAPRLATGRHVVAMDLSGHGDSSWRPHGYRIADWAREVLAVATVASSAGPPVAVGHSMGAAVIIRAALEPGHRLSGLIVLDGALKALRDADVARRRQRAEKVSPAFPSQQSVVDGFHTLPPDGSERHLPILVRHIAEHSVRRVDDGWRWKLDRRVFLRDWLTIDDIAPLDVPTLLVAAEHGMLTEERAAAMARRLGGKARTVTVPTAGHHLMLDQPAALTACLATVLAMWQPAVNGHELPTPEHRPQ